MTDGPAGSVPPGELALRWLQAQHEVAGHAAHELRNALNGVAVNLAVVQSRLRRQQAPESVTRFADAAVAQLDVLTAQVDALLGLTRAPQPPLDVGVLAGHLAVLSGRGGADAAALAVTAPPPGAARTASDPTVVRLLLAAVAAAAIDSARGYECVVGADDRGEVRVTVRGIDGPVVIDGEVERLAQRAGVDAARPGGTELVLTFPPANRTSAA